VYDLATKDLDPPLAIVDLAAFDANAADLARRAAGKPIRVVSKSVRCRYLLERVLAMPGFEGLMCYSLTEALWHVEQGTTDDIVVAYPTVDHGALRRLAKDELARAAISIMVDSAAHLDLVDSALGHDHPEIRVCLELDASWRPLPGAHVGTRRSPVFTARQAAELARIVLARKGFRVSGLMGYEGQIAGIGDTAGNGVKNAVIRWMQGRSAAELARRRAMAVATLFSGGYIASGPIGPSRSPTPYLPAGLELLALEGAGEVQSPVTGKAARNLKLGDRVWLRHAKAGELAERFTDYHVIVGDRVERTVPTYRGEGKNFG
jgi:D-serine deaminase-like pyridoxal phosphate-dependent protein